MPRFKEEQPVSAPQYTIADYDFYREGIKPYSHEKVPFLHFLASKNVIRFDSREGSGFCVSSPVEYTRWNNIRAKVEAYDDAKLKEVLDTMPEERVAWRAKIDAMFKNFKSAAREMRLSTVE